MVPPVATQNGGGGSSQDAKHVLDEFGQQVYEQVKSEAETYKDALKGNLTSSIFFGGETANSLNPCTLVDQYRSNANGGTIKNDPCRKDGTGKEEVNRFSVKEQAEYDNKKIKCSNGRDFGACAPYRRLSLCNKNLEYLNSYDGNNAKDYLLAKVCYAAKHEGESIKTHYKQYDSKYPGSGHTTCTMLARSFADIGDIVRGKDLFLGNDKEKDQRKVLDENLKTIFKNIYEKLLQDNKTNGKTNGKTLQKRYKGDKNNNFFKLREDWWTANRATIWEALTCEAPEHASYFRTTCSMNGSGAQARNQCRCQKKNGQHDTDQVPTYFDYVPQYLRWFEEWAEDFCRKKKKKVENAKKKCREQDKEGNQRYCSRNGFDCEQTVNARGKLRYGKQCTDCFFACNPYVEWIEKQKEQFDKQKEKYPIEIEKYTNGGGGSGRTRQRRGARNENYDGYEKNFYEQLKKGDYGTVDKFLQLLNNETTCKDITDEKEGRISFENVNTGSTGGSVRVVSGGTSGTSGTNNENEGTFYHSEYCQPCPYCGMKKTNDGRIVKKREDDNCKRGNLYRPKDGQDGTKIEILKSGDGQTEIAEKLKAFCEEKNGGGGGRNSNSSLYDPWQCYKGEDVDKNGEEEDDEEDYQNMKNAGGLCILPNPKKNKEEGGNTSEKEPAEIQKTFHDFFYYWVAHMLKDSIYWRTKKIKKCLENGKQTKCKNGCNNDCECFKRWVKQKEKEWDPIKKQFSKQEGLDSEGHNNSPSGLNLHMTPDFVLKTVLELEFANKNTEEDKENNVSAEEIDLINKMLKEDKTTAADVADNEENTPIDKLLKHEKKIAENCLQTHKEKCEDTAGVRSLKPADPEDLEEDDDDDEDDNGDDHTQDPEEPQEEVAPQPAAPTTDPSVDVCTTVKSALEGDLSEACNQKYGPKAPTSWKCVSSGNDKVTGGGVPGKDTGGICVPPRRRKLYIGGLTKWAKSDEATKGPTSQESGEAQTPQDETSSPSGDKLREAFIQSAAIETFFLWDRYKKEWLAQKKAEKGLTDGPFSSGSSSSGIQVLDGAAGPRLPLQPQLSGISGMQTQPIALPELAGLNNSNDPQSKLQQTGEIPNDFLKLMFYTLGDYRDILYSGSNDTSDSKGTSNSNDIKNIVIEASGDKQDEMKKIQKAIDEHINSLNKASSVSQKTVQSPQTQHSDKDPESWWEKHGKDIWRGMVCALTYKENGSGGEKKIEKDEQVYNKFFGTQNGKPGLAPVTPGLPPGTAEVTFTTRYKYDIVKLEDENSGPKTASPSSGDNTPTTLNNPKLKDFVEIPTFFRWLHEWGSDFCGTRQRMLKDVRDNCRNSEQDGKRHCSGDGHDCTENGELKHKDILADLYCPGCYEQCRKYRKWIDIKFVEYHKQENTYKVEHGKLKPNSENKDYKKYYEEIKQHTTADKFLKELKHCKNGQNNSEEKINEEDKKNNEINFENIRQTFSRSTYCKTCPIYGVKCNGSGRGRSNGCNVNGNGETWESVFNGMSENSGKTTTIDVQMIDRRGPFIEKYLGNSKNSFKISRLFNGLKEQQWECRYKDEKTDICKLKNFKDKIDLNEYTTFKVFLVYWLEDFLYGYYILKKKKIIEQCTKKEGKTCSEEPKNDCACVGKWVQQKGKEWESIKDHFKIQNNERGYDIKYKVKTFLETLIPRIALTNDKKHFKNLDAFLRSYACKCAAKLENTQENDLVLCLLEDLDTKIKTCEDQNSVEKTEKECQEYPPLPDEEYENEEENDKKVEPPTFCEIKDTPEPADEDACKAAPKETAPSSEENQPETPVIKPEEEAPAPEKSQPKEDKKVSPPSNVFNNPAVIPALMSSTIMWSIGIGFAAFTYFYLKVLYICGCMWIKK
ncbi:hypothetical protein PFBG_01722 [Plasmodium falciparum 7G8]|uniref:Erythrocyte membrane protein 1 n=3 Tax=Plasmodium falciparum TaxID=5833 RepID=W7F4E4_PLAF8|nr:hypothetical protein PFBG_01722 [Plasmodium falciparum 7G8]